MTNRRIAVSWNAVLAAAILIAVAVQLTLVIQGHNVLVAPGDRPATSTRVIRFFSYFTVESNLLVAFCAVTLAVRPDRDGRIWRVIRADALVGITVTGLIYVTLLGPNVEVHGIAAQLTNVAFHYVAPLMAVIGWLLFGPRPRIDRATVLASLIWPAAYVAYTLAHGAAGHWYPYPFIDVTLLGYPTTIRNGVGICLLLLGVVVVASYLDEAMARGGGRRRR